MWVTIVSNCPWSYVGEYRSEQACVKTILLKIVWVICHGLVQFICYTSNSKVLQVDVSILFLRKKESIGKITNYNAFIEIQTYWMPEIGVRNGQYCQENEWKHWVKEEMDYNVLNNSDRKGVKINQRLNVWKLGRQWYHWQ